MKGMLITFEGIDGSGKSTIAKIVYKDLKNKGFDVILDCEPTKSWLGDAVKKSYNENVSKFTEAFLFMADRATHVLKIKELLQQNKIVILDRYYDSTIAYQSVNLKKLLTKIGIDSFDWLIEINKVFTITPDITFLLVIDPKISLERVSARGKHTKFEKLEFLTKVQENYLKIAESEKRFIKLDATRDIEFLVDEVVKMISFNTRYNINI